jgi:hypothetical protein
MNVDTNTNYLTNSLSAAKQFAQQAAEKILNSTAVTKLQNAVQRKPWGAYQSSLGTAGSNIAEQLRNVQGAAQVKTTQGVYPGGKYSNVGSKQTYDAPRAANVAASIPADILTNATRRQLWRYTNMHRLVGDLGSYVAPRLGLDSPLTGAAVAAAVPIGISMMSGQTGPLSEGLRPKGQKAVAPVSKEEDPTGRTSRSVLLETAMRYGLGQRGQLLGYNEFKKERPDIAPSTYTQYRRYENMKPEPGKNIRIDPESQSFSALGGAVRGTARGLNDPEVRLKGVPITLSSVVGTAAGLGAIKGLSKALAPVSLGTVPDKFKLKHDLTSAVLGKPYSPISIPVSKQIEYTRAHNPPSLGEKIGDALGDRYYDPALLATGAVTALAVGHVTKKLLQKSAERRIKKENPVEYLKHKHGSLEAASAALKQPTARSWQQLVPYVQ